MVRGNMGRFENMLNKLSRFMDAVAGWGIVAVMALTVFNILTRRLVGWSILGISEYVSVLMALVIGSSVAYCALMDGHIRVEVFVQKLPGAVKRIITAVSGIISFIFFTFVSWQLIKYGNRIRVSGEVTSTAEIHFYPFIYIVAFGVFILSIVNLIQAIKMLKGSENNG